ncbi:MAG: hypothetical protein PF447_04440 [Spirochaetaceae bacterium]|jgi:hypothetical protein|nr:hypothetical protein [Spirochaetaceae bacterium]
MKNLLHIIGLGFFFLLTPILFSEPNPLIQSRWSRVFIGRDGNPWEETLAFRLEDGKILLDNRCRRLDEPSWDVSFTNNIHFFEDTSGILLDVDGGFYCTYMVPTEHYYRIKDGLLSLYWPPYHTQAQDDVPYVLVE